MNNKAEGHGIKYYKDGRKYEGEFKNDLRHGYGVLNRPDGTILNGLLLQLILFLIASQIHYRTQKLHWQENRSRRFMIVAIIACVPKNYTQILSMTFM